MDRFESPIEFLTDGRTYVPSGGRSGDFIVVFGTLVTGPPAPTSWDVVRFPAEVTRPDGTSVPVNGAQLDFPIADESPIEGPFVLLRGVRPADVPAGSLIVSRGTTS